MVLAPAALASYYILVKKNDQRQPHVRFNLERPMVLVPAILNFSLKMTMVLALSVSLINFT